MSLVAFAGYDETENQVLRFSPKEAPKPPVKKKARTKRKARLSHRRKHTRVSTGSVNENIVALFGNGMDTWAIAQFMKLSEATVYNRLAKTRAGE